MEKYVLSKEQMSFIERMKQPFAIYQFLNKRVVTIALSEGFCKLFGYEDRAQAYYDMDHNMYNDTHPEDVARIASVAVRFATEGGRYEVIYRTRKKGTSDYIVVHAMGEHVYTRDGTRLAHVWYTDEGDYAWDSEASGFKLTEALSNALHEQDMISTSHYDLLTGLPNMTYFFELVEAEKADILKRGGQPMLLYIDFSGMKFFNTKYGFAEGDRMLHLFADILKRYFGTENCCHIGADHFAVGTEEEGLEKKLEDIICEWNRACDGKNLPVHVGIYRSSRDKVHASIDLDRAKLACNALKEKYTSCFRYYSRDLSDDLSYRQYIIENVDRAIRENWIKVYLQPIVRAVNGKICDVETLSRWVDPEMGLSSPDRFIPALEEAGLIYKLDLYMVDQVLKTIKTQKEKGFYIVPHSINLSRSDFDSCDIVEEIRKRVDAAGVDRDLITIELTESVIGSDFDFMKKQVERFQKLGFPVWMDDFGSGYSSLDVLQSIKFDLIKFNMSFMRKLDTGDDAKVILTELMRMATSLGLDTVCEGVETESQVRFLKEIGCSKLQGYYFNKPMPFETFVKKLRDHTLTGNENPAESDYYESIGRVNLFDLGVITSEEDNAFHNTFDMIPIAVLEVKGDSGRYVRSNRSYQEFLRRLFDIDIQKENAEFALSPNKHGVAFIAALKQCCVDSNSIFFDEKMSDGSVVHCFVRRIGTNPVTGSTAAAVAVLSIKEPDESTTYADMARALAADYYNLFVIDMDTNDYTEYSSKVGDEEMSIVRHGKEFFESAKRDTMTRIFEKDRAPFLELFTKENVIRDLDAQGVFTTTYRLIDTGTPMYVNMKITRLRGGNRIILGISIIDAHMKEKVLYEQP